MADDRLLVPVPEAARTDVADHGHGGARPSPTADAGRPRSSAEAVLSHDGACRGELAARLAAWLVDVAMNEGEE